MSNHKSYEEFVLGAYRALLDDCALYYPRLSREFVRDYTRISSAIECQGIRFTLDTLPSFCKHFDKCLADGRLTVSGLPHMRPYRSRGVIPRLFRGLLLRVFDGSGALRLDPDVDAIRLLRQLYRAMKKLELASSRLDTALAARDFFRIDREVREGDLEWDNHSHFEASGASGLSFTDILETDLNSERQLHLFEELAPSPSTLSHGLWRTVQQVADLISAHLGVFDPLAWKPKHGPGAVSDQRWGTYKYVLQNWPKRLEKAFPWADLAHANYSQVDFLSPIPSRVFDAELGSNLIAVPKTLSTPRLIASEPTSHQWCQQIAKDYFYRRIGETFLSRFLSFTDQSKNGKLALQASQNATHATIDLSSASDRVSCWHVERLFRRLPSLLDALQSCRTTWIKQDLCREVPKYQLVRKYSTMGNATIFPVQSILFLAISLGCLCYQRNILVNERNLKRLGQKTVRVFGDDIIVPDDVSRVVVEAISALGLKVNDAKTFLVGNFRESCGVDAYGGTDVTPVGILKLPVRTSPGSIVSSVDVHHNLCEAGLLRTAAYIQKTASRVVSNKIRYVKHRSGLFGWSDLYGVQETRTRVRYSRTLHRPEVYCYRPKVEEHRTSSVESAGLLQFFTEAAKVVTSSASSIGWSLRRPKAGLSLGWVPVQ